MGKSKGELQGLYTPTMRSMTKQKKCKEDDGMISNILGYSEKNILESSRLFQSHEGKIG